MQKEEMIIQLIKEEIKNKCLMYAFQCLGFDCSFFIIDISHIVFDSTGIRGTTELYSWYYNLINRAVDDICTNNIQVSLNNWSKVIYSELLEKKLRLNMQEIMKEKKMK